jgi:polysaccharide pyruvyl transferase WcaK-like protein
VLVDPGCYNLLNMGGVAMMQVALGRVHARWPGADIAVLTDEPALLARHFPYVRPVAHGGLKHLLADHFLLGGIEGLLPTPVTTRLLRWQQGLRASHPAWLHMATLMRMRLGRENQREFREFLHALRGADVIIVSGAGGINDDFAGYVREVATLLEAAVVQGSPTAMFGQGVGPLNDALLRARLARTLPRVNLIALRESRIGPAILADLGVPADRVVQTGDDAVGLAAAAPHAERRSLGVNLRFARYAGVDESVIPRLRPAVHAFARARNAPILGAPIGLHANAPDEQAIRLLLEGGPGDLNAGEGLDTPQAVIEQVGRCRVMLTGAYHAAVFALAQGIPTVCLAESGLYVDKFAGLAASFGAGCAIVRMSGDGLADRVSAALEAAWTGADALAAPLRESAALQASTSREAYDRFFRQAETALAGGPSGRELQVAS